MEVMWRFIYLKKTIIMVRMIKKTVEIIKKIEIFSPKVKGLN